MSLNVYIYTTIHKQELSQKKKLICAVIVFFYCHVMFSAVMSIISKLRFIWWTLPIS